MNTNVDNICISKLNFVRFLNYERNLYDSCVFLRTSVKTTKLRSTVDSVEDICCGSFAFFFKEGGGVDD